MKTRSLGLTRLQWILVIILIAQIIMAIAINIPRNKQAISGPLLNNFDPSNIVQIDIESQTNDPMRISKVEGSWVLADAGNYPVKSDKVTEILNKIKNIQTNRLVAQTEASHTQLQVAEDNYVNRIILTNDSGESFIIFIGSSGGTGATHVRNLGSDQVYLTSELASWEIAPTMSSWIDTIYITIPEDQSNKVVIQNSNGIFNFTKGEDGQWIYDGLLDGEAFNSSDFQTSISRFFSLNMQKPLGTVQDASMGLDQPSAIATFEINNQDGSTSAIEVKIGKMLAADVSYTAKASTSPYYVSIANYIAEPLINMDHLSLLEEEPTPTPTLSP
jgi:hypothetical protein